MILEICANSLASAIAAQEGGADRVELCENLNEGGTTPSHGAIFLSRKALHIKLYVLIRPRSGDFIYSPSEYEIIKADIQHCKTLGCDGVVIGLLDKEGNVDVKRTRELVAFAAPMGVTFHRAFDCSRDGFQALEDVINCGCERILTSGMQNKATEGVGFLADLIAKADDRIRIMIGSGVNEDNITELAIRTKASEFHTSAKVKMPIKMHYHNPSIEHMGTVEESDADTVSRIKMRLDNF